MLKWCGQEMWIESDQTLFKTRCGRQARHAGSGVARDSFLETSRCWPNRYDGLKIASIRGFSDDWAFKIVSQGGEVSYRRLGFKAARARGLFQAVLVP